MKKTIIIALCVCIAVSVTACSQSDVLSIEPEISESQYSSRVISEPSLTRAESLQIVAESSAINEADPYLRLIGKELSELTSEDFKLLLTTSIEELALIYDLELTVSPETPILPENAAEIDKLLYRLDEQRIELFHILGYDCVLPFGGLKFRYNDIGPEIISICLIAQSSTEKLNDLQLGMTLSDIMAEWGETDKLVYGGPHGYGGEFYQYIEYKDRKGFDYHLECEAYNGPYFSWYQLDKSEWPWEDFPQVVTYAIISLEGTGSFRVR